MFDEFLKQAEELRSADEPFAIAVVVRSEPPVSGKPGYKAIIRADGTMSGWIGGGCTQPLVIREAIRSLEDGKPRLVRITPESGAAPETGVTEYAMTCHSGGALDVYIEPILPRPHLVIFGRSLVAQTLARLAAAIDYTVTIVASGARGANFPTADRVIDGMEPGGLRITAQTFIVVATQGEDDEEAVDQAVRAGAPYTAFVASKTKAGKVFDYLAGKGISRQELSHIKAPAGLDIQATSPEEIAVSILAEIIQAKANKTSLEAPGLRDTRNAQPQEDGQSVPTGREALHAGSVRPQGRARDPICGMEVDTGHTRHKSEYSAQTFYFCCMRCKEKFDQSPNSYAAG